MRLHRTWSIVIALAAAFGLAGCESLDLESIWNSKKPLPGERRAMFPQGVPGVEQGVPPDLVRGYQQPAETEPAPPPEAPAAEKPKRTRAKAAKKD